MAVAQVLSRHGVTVVDVKDTASAVARAGPDATLAIVGAESVSEHQLDLYAKVETEVVLIAPDLGLRDRLERELAPGQLTVVDDPEVFTNGGVTDGDNADQALRLLGGQRRLIWQIARREDAEGASADIWALLPPWADLVAVQLLIAAGGAALWRGRRMGRLAPDELPVSVPASEVTEGLGRLYGRARAAGHAAAALRAGAAARLAAALGLGEAAPPATLVAGIARAQGRDQAAISDLLYGPPPGSASQLAALAQALDQVEKEVLSQ
ncbi:MAG: hypothetical protein LBF40_00655, partial [Deltaproteobacteria bacterium]|jgi:hypothetical protein|nr:hypothetical protein [Deltaproteobacteria bacterium]